MPAANKRIRKYNKEQQIRAVDKKKEGALTLELVRSIIDALLLLMRVAAPKGGGGTTDFFFLGGERARMVDGCSSPGEEEDVVGFL